VDAHRGFRARLVTRLDALEDALVGVHHVLRRLPVKGAPKQGNSGHFSTVR
jgi:hypothetical protein